MEIGTQMNNENQTSDTQQSKDTEPIQNSWKATKRKLQAQYHSELTEYVPGQTEGQLIVA